MAEHVYDSSDSCTGKSAVQEPLEYSIYGLLKKYQITITTAESATGGMIASTLINVPGISEFFTEGYVTYSNEAKVKMIHVAPETIDTVHSLSDVPVTISLLHLIPGSVSVLLSLYHNQKTVPAHIRCGCR